ncbi:hypothetical protein FB451DRAFT_1491511 [Mycena latifolia]|nr:hypothetical protein FB451DRAFT_1491511 [Mycena latifolia]
MLRALFPCCLRPADTDDDYTVIPNETARLLPAPEADLLPSYSAGPPMDTQKLNDRMGTIVRAKEGKMVNVSARTPFVMQRAPSPSSFASTPPDPPTPGPESAPAARTSRRPPVLTITPARASLYAEGRSRYSSPAGSRSPSRRRPDPAYAYGVRAKQASTASASEWLGGSASEAEVEDSSGAPVDSSSAAPEEVRTPSLFSSWTRASDAHTHVVILPPQANGVALPTAVPAPPRPTGSEGEAEAKGLGIAFSWSDT